MRTKHNIQNVLGVVQNNHIIEITFYAKNAEEAETDLVNAKAAKR